MKINRSGYKSRAAINTTELVVEIRPEKNSGPYGI